MKASFTQTTVAFSSGEGQLCNVGKKRHNQPSLSRRNCCTYISWVMPVARTNHVTCLPVWVCSGISYHLPAKHWLPSGSCHRAFIWMRASFSPPASRCSLAVADWPLRGQRHPPPTQLAHSQSPCHKPKCAQLVHVTRLSPIQQPT